MLTKYKIVPFCPYHFVHTILSNDILSVYHFVHNILSVPYCPLSFCPVTLFNSLLHSACYLRTTCLLSASFLRHLFLTVAGLRAPLSRFLEGVLYKYPE